MIDKTSIIESVKRNLSPTDRANTAGIDIAFANCLDDLSLELAGEGFLLSYDTPIAENLRKFTLRGENDDLMTIFSLKFTDAVMPLSEIGRERFLNEADDPSQLPDTPTMYAILGAEDGFPIVRFNCPCSPAKTLTVYYFAGMTTDNVTQLRFGSVVVDGTTARFKGVDTPEGQAAYARFQNGVRKMRGADYFKTKPTKRFRATQDDINIEQIRKNYRSAR
jgi:hypothetical protein